MFTDGGLSPYPVNVKHLQGLLTQRTAQRDRYKRNAEELTGELAEVRKRLCTAEAQVDRHELRCDVRARNIRLGRTEGPDYQPRHGTAYLSGDLCQLRVLGFRGDLQVRTGDGVVVHHTEPHPANKVCQLAINFLPNLPATSECISRDAPAAAGSTDARGRDPWSEPRLASDDEGDGDDE